MAMVLLLALSCSDPKATPSAESPATATTDQKQGPRVTFPDGHLVHLEMANDNELRAQGLMYRDHLPPDRGMLFLFPEDGEYGFWMKNTRIPLDMIWLDSGHRIAHVKFNVPPCKADPCPSYPPNARARYVLEVAGGVAKQHGLKAGDVLRFEGIDGYEAR
jgi:uncharacterized membrane protein (UPF0127 family)